jgi:hypothetical protein
MIEADRTPPNRLALAAFVLGVIALCLTAVLFAGLWHSRPMLPWDRGALWRKAWIPRWFWPALVAGLAGFVIARMARARLSAAPRGRRRDRRMARAGRALAIVSLAISLLGIPLLTLGSRIRSAATLLTCEFGVHNLMAAVQMYESDYGRYPGKDNWSDALLPYFGGNGRDSSNRNRYWVCPEARGKCSYAYNSALDSRAVKSLTRDDLASVIVIFESDRGWNAHGRKELLPDFPRHLGHSYFFNVGHSYIFNGHGVGGFGDSYGFADGHCAWIARRKPPGEVRWDTKWPKELDNPSVRWQPEGKAAKR